MTAIDLCCGAGGVTAGLRMAGICVIGAVDIDKDCTDTMRMNHRRVRVLHADLTKTEPRELRRELGLRRRKVDVLAVCTPCQTYSYLGARGRTRSDPREALVTKVGDIIADLEPRAIIMENIPRIRSHYRFKRLLSRIRGLGYSVRAEVVDASAAGVAQRRLRLVVIAVRGSTKIPSLLAFMSWRSKPPKPVTVALAEARGAKAGDALSRPRSIQPRTLALIKALPKNGGSRTDLPARLQLPCHRRLAREGRNESLNVYGRMRQNEPSPTLTTRCTTPSCGRFVHPLRHRPITLREAACIQSFPVGYRFSGNYCSIEAQIGNAVPPLLAYATARLVKSLLPTSRERG